MVVKCVSFLEEDQINIIPETFNKPTVNKGRTILMKLAKTVLVTVTFNKFKFRYM